MGALLDLHAPSEEPSAAALEVQAARARLLGRLSSGLVHEARNPLNAMAIHLEVLADKLRDETGSVPAHLEKNLGAARNQIRRLDEILRRFGDFATGRPPSSASDVETLWSRASGLCEYQMRRAGVSVEAELEPGLALAADPTLACQALLELMMEGADRCPRRKMVFRARAEGARALLTLEAGGEPAEGGKPEPTAALERLVRELGGEMTSSDAAEGWSLTLHLPRERASSPAQTEGPRG